MSDRPSITPEELQAQAERCRRLARQVTDNQVAKALLELAGEFEKQAELAAKDGERHSG